MVLTQTSLYVIIAFAAALMFWQALDLAAGWIQRQWSKSPQAQPDRAVSPSINRFARDRWSASTILAKAR